MCEKIDFGILFCQIILYQPQLFYNIVVEFVLIIIVEYKSYIVTNGTSRVLKGRFKNILIEGNTFSTILKNVNLVPSTSMILW